MIGETVINQTRLYTGLVLFAYIAGHLANLALGLISLGVMNRALDVALAIWGNPIGQVALGGSFVVHFALGLRALFRRRTLRMPIAESAQLSLGFLIPLLLAAHFAGTRYVISTLGAHIDYSVILLNLWVVDPGAGLAQALLVIVAWSHGCIGLGYNLRLKRWYVGLRSYLLVVAVLIPVLALLGYFEAGRAVAELARSPQWVAHIVADTGVAPQALTTAAAFANVIRIGVIFCLAIILLGRLGRVGLRRQGQLITLTYPSDVLVRIKPGMSVLEASREAGIPHASVCGGRGRCSTCRIRVSGTTDAIPGPTDDETAVLQRIGMPPNVRLACRLRPVGNIAVTPLLPADVSMSSIQGSTKTGVEREIAILFCDIRSFTKLAEGKLPYDVVFILNRYFAEMGAAIEGAGGRVDKFVGDGVMGLFGLDGMIDRACRQAVAAAAEMSQRIRRLNQELAPDLPEPLRVGIGIHAGSVIVGEMGWGDAVGLTAIGDAVNTASRLEALTKELDVELVISEEVARYVAIDHSSWTRHDTQLRGRTDTLTIHARSGLVAEPAEG